MDGCCKESVWKKERKIRTLKVGHDAAWSGNERQGEEKRKRVGKQKRRGSDGKAKAAIVAEPNDGKV